MRKAHFLVLPLFFVLFFSCSLIQLKAQGTEPSVKEYEIGGIIVSGTQFLDADFLKIKTGLLVGQRISIPGEDIGRAIQSLWQEGLFADIKVNITKTIGTTIFLDFVVQERPRLSKYSYKGVSKSEAEDLNKKIPFIKGKVVTPNLIVNAQQIIRDYYYDKGFSNLKITTNERIDSIVKNSIAISFVVNKGKKVKIEEIYFIGNQNVSNSKLKRTLKETKERFRLRPFTKADWKVIKNTTPQKTLKGLYQLSLPMFIDNLADRFRIKFSGSKFQKEAFEDDKQKIIEVYNAKGYRDAQMIQDSIYKHSNGNLIVKVKVDEGKQYHFRNIYWKGNSKHTDKELATILNIQKGDIYDKSSLDSKLNMNPNSTDVSSLYMDDGYLFFQITPIEIAVEEDSIDLEIRIYEGQQATINKVIIKGNDKTKEHVIRRELRTVPGQKFSRSDIIRSQRELATLGYFNGEKIGINPIAHPENGTVDIEYTLEEKSSDQIELQAGWGGKSQGVIGTVGLSFNNFSLNNIGKAEAWTPVPSGDGQKFSIRVQSSGNYYQSGNVSFTEPWLGGKKPNSLSVSYFLTRWAGLNLSNPSLMLTNGVTVGFGRRLKWPDDYFTHLSNLNYENYSLKNQSASDFLISDGRLNNINFENVISRNSLNDPIYPRTGSRFTFTVKLTPPYSLFNNLNYEEATKEEKYKFVEYHKWRFDAEWFTKVWGNLVIRTSSKFGFLGNYSGRTGDSPFDRFELGGDGISNFRFFGKDIFSLRGYEANGANSVTNSDSRLGYNIFNKFTLELRYPITLNPSSTIYMLAFAEGGNVYNKIQNYDPFNLKRTAGLGVRVLLPMFGLLGVDYGFGFDKNLSTNAKLTDYGKFNIILGFEPQ
jgi:outer membrane protein insertion porin family